jgi:hypothetical protein
MPRKASSTAATGGKGYTFADKVAAGFFVQLLARDFPLGRALGWISEIHFETKESGRSLDDLLLLLQDGAALCRWSISVKSNRQLSREGFNAAFVRDVWADWRGERVAGFDQDSDLLGLVTGVVGDGPLQDWEDLRKEAASTTPERFLLRLDGTKQISSEKKKLFASLYPVEQPDRANREATVRLAGRTHVLHFNEKRDEGRFVNQCANLISSGTIEEGTKLWNALCSCGMPSANLLRITGEREGFLTVRNCCGTFEVLST